MSQVKDDKIQTGLRIPQRQYEDLTLLANKMGVSLNSLALILIDVGLSAVNLGIQATAHSLPHNHQDTF